MNFTDRKVDIMITNEENWIDLSGLPRFVGVTKHKNINWKASPGYSVEFCFKGICGVANILDMNVKTRRLRVFIDGWTVPNGEEIPIQNFQNCWLNKLYNKIAVLRPDLVMYLENAGDAYKYPVYYNDKLNMVCPKCGAKKVCKMGDVAKSGFHCDECQDGVSYPNKLMFNILTQLKIPFITEANRSTKGFEWIPGKYRYDFYFVINGVRYFVEMDGHFHDLPQEQKNDAIKGDIARKHNISLIRIDCKYDKLPFPYIKNNIENSKLSDVLDLDKLNWEECDRYATGSVLNDVCDMWENQQMSVGEIMAKTQLNKSTVRDYLMRGVSLSLCPSYNKTESRKRIKRYLDQYVAYVVDNEIAYLFEDAEEVISIAERVGAPKFIRKSIIRVCRGSLPNYHGMDFKFVCKTKYKYLKDNINQNCDIQEVLCRDQNCRPIAVIENNNVICVFRNAEECARQSMSVFGRQYNTTNIHRVLLGQQSSYFGKDFKRITKEEYEQYKMIINNNEVVFNKEAIL